MKKKRRNRVKQTTSLEARLSLEAQRLRNKAYHMPLGSARELLFRRARQMDEAREMSEVLTLPPTASQSSGRSRGC
ncbi:hypothetical protein H8A99_00570 [Bradyrhizobium sp. Arg68]|uniref:hypothetical protein n=1 Tax=Bradyrhizobium ivorense TaxID=2511166 RepID=UPI001E3FEB4C|nr:hypothetical protein [Bradyrhizobium ivorense]MCC8935032.1 hypothetical protein [Bradyrhizobium ivorense]